MMSLEEAIGKAKNLIYESLAYDFTYRPCDSNFSNGYFRTNEYVLGYLKKVDLKLSKYVLTVLASGDQAFSLISEGIKNIDTFDVNALSEYIALGLKRAMILKYDYQAFLDNLFLLTDQKVRIDNDEEMAILSDLLPFMESKYRMFWQTLIDYTTKVQKETGNNRNLIHILDKNDVTNFYNYRKMVNFLKNDAHYQRLRENIGKANITFQEANALNLPNTFRGPYDLVLLSNILDYFDFQWGDHWDYKMLKKYEENLAQIIVDNGVVMLEYVFEYESLATIFDNCYPLIDGSKIVASDLETEELIVLPRYATHTSKDAIILQRKKG